MQEPLYQLGKLQAAAAELSCVIFSQRETAGLTGVVRTRLNTRSVLYMKKNLLRTEGNGSHSFLDAANEFPGQCTSGYLI